LARWGAVLPPVLSNCFVSNLLFQSGKNNGGILWLIESKLKIVPHAVPVNRSVPFHVFRKRVTEKERSMKMSASAAEHVPKYVLFHVFQKFNCCFSVLFT
jgi:hypothetical protein